MTHTVFNLGRMRVRLPDRSYLGMRNTSTDRAVVEGLHKDHLLWRLTRTFPRHQLLIVPGVVETLEEALAMLQAPAPLPEEMVPTAPHTEEPQEPSTPEQEDPPPVEGAEGEEEDSEEASGETASSASVEASQDGQAASEGSRPMGRRGRKRR